MGSSESTIKSYREMAMLSVRQMADRMGISENAYRQLENMDTRTGKLVNTALDIIIGGKPGLKHSEQIIASHVRNDIDAFIRENPNATWEEIHKSVPSRFSTPKSMSKNYYKYLRTRGIYTRKNQRTSKYIGVSKRGNKWRVCTTVDGKSVHVGLFNTELEAAKAYDSYVTEHRGMEAKTNRTEGLL